MSLNVYAVNVTKHMQRSQFIGNSSSGDYVYWEADVPYDGTHYEEWLVEELGEDRFQLWHLDRSVPSPEIAHYRPDDLIGGGELASAGFADVRRVHGPRADD